jgi:hypothetical protein
MTDIAPRAARSPGHARHRWLLPVAALVIVLGGVGVGVAIASRDAATTPNASNVTNAVSLGAVSEACNGWLAANPDEGSASAWCNPMIAWLGVEVASGKATGMMWSDPTRMLSACQTWMATLPPATWPTGRCAAMVDWMRDHATNGGWTGGMMPGWSGTMMSSRSTP